MASRACPIPAQPRRADGAPGVAEGTAARESFGALPHADGVGLRRAAVDGFVGAHQAERVAVADPDAPVLDFRDDGDIQGGECRDAGELAASEMAEDAPEG